MGQTKEQWLATIQSGLVTELKEHAKALPRGFAQERFVLNALTVISDNARNFQNIAPESIQLALAKGAYLGLDFLNGECYAIPYGNVANFQTDYKGEIKLAKKYSRNKIKDVYAKNVRAGDHFEESIENGRQNINFKPKPFNDAAIIGTFAVVLYEDGSMIYDTMSAAEIEHTRNTYSKAKNSQAWKESSGEMYKKTVLRRLLKLVDLEFDTKEQIQAFDEGSGVVFAADFIDDSAAGAPVNVFAGQDQKPQGAPAQQPAPGGSKGRPSAQPPKTEPPRKPQSKPQPQIIDADFQEFDRQFDAGGYNPDYDIPEDWPRR